MVLDEWFLDEESVQVTKHETENLSTYLKEGKPYNELQHIRYAGISKTHLQDICPV